ncbi:MAG: arginine--tRNA ligase [Lentisphaeria bacterium]|nr:arginine--tRNA ligase [Lentisphaeria bacterium]
MDFTFAEDLREFLAHAYGVEVGSIPVGPCPAEFRGDLTVSGYVLARQLRRNPLEIAAKSAEFLGCHEDVGAVEAVKAFVNVTLVPAALMRDTVADGQKLLGSVVLPAPERRRILIEFSAPNTNKPQHLGHVRNNCIGMATAAILRRVGHDVARVNLVNDRGIHICKSMVAYLRFGQGETPESSGRKGDHLVGEYYVAFDAEFRRQVAALREARPEWAKASDEELFLRTEIGRTAQDMLIAWENGDGEVRALWERMNGWVLAGFEETYRRLGVCFEKTYLESETYTLGRDIIRQGLESGVFRRREDGAVVIDFSDPALGSKVVLRSDGTSVYVTQDIGTTLLKQNEFSPDQQIWVVGDEQVYHFRVLFAILGALGYPWADRLVHMAYGMVHLPSGRMKSREGTVVDADDLVQELEDLARAATLERAGAEVPEDIEERARVIGMAALKFMLLKVSPRTTLLFDPEASMTFEGDTGPYVLYAYARIRSMLRKAEAMPDEDRVDWAALGSAEEKALALRCAAYPDVVRKAAAELDSSALAGYLLDLAKDFSRFYRSCPVLSAPAAAQRDARLLLSDRVRAILRDGLETLTIGVLESM